jgi:hypothetical protein
MSCLKKVTVGKDKKSSVFAWRVFKNIVIVLLPEFNFCFFSTIFLSLLFVCDYFSLVFGVSFKSRLTLPKTKIYDILSHSPLAPPLSIVNNTLLNHAPQNKSNTFEMPT